MRAQGQEPAGLLMLTPVPGRAGGRPAFWKLLGPVLCWGGASAPRQYPFVQGGSAMCPHALRQLCSVLWDVADALISYR